MMAADFLDTNALVKHYHVENGSELIDRLWNESSRQLFISRLSALEMTSVFAAKVRGGMLSQSNFDQLMGRFLADLTTTQRLTTADIWHELPQKTLELLRRHGTQRRLRTLDAMQLAVATELFKKQAITRIVTSDQDLLVAAQADGIPTLDPENP